MARTKKQKEEVVAQEHKKEEHAITAEGVEKPNDKDIKKELEEAWLDCTYELCKVVLSAAEEAEKEAVEKFQQAKWWNRNYRRKRAQKAEKIKFLAAGALYYAEKLKNKTL